MFYPKRDRLTKSNILQQAHELELLTEKLDHAQTPERFTIMKSLCDEIIDASRCYIRTRIRRSGDEPWPNCFHGVVFPNGIQIRMTKEESLLDSDCEYKEIAIMGLSYKYNTGTPDIRLRCTHNEQELDCPWEILSGKGVARLITVLSRMPLTRNHELKERTYKYFSWILGPYQLL